MTRGKIARRMARARAHWHHGATAVRVVDVATTGELLSALDAATWWNTSRTKRLRIHLAPGVYHARVELLDGIDLAGDAEITWDGVGDTILTHAADSTLTGLTVRHLGNGPAYAIHADAPCRGSTLTLDRVTASSESKAALGAGLTGGQRIDARHSTFTSTQSTAVYVHNWGEQPAPAVARFADCTATAPAVGVAWVQLGSGQRDELRWSGPIHAPLPLEADDPPPVLVFDAVTA